MTSDFIRHREDVLDLYEQIIDEFQIRTQNYEKRLLWIAVLIWTVKAVKKVQDPDSVIESSQTS
jgi:hypothetical protein